MNFYTVQNEFGYVMMTACSRLSVWKMKKSLPKQLGFVLRGEVVEVVTLDVTPLATPRLQNARLPLQPAALEWRLTRLVNAVAHSIKVCPLKDKTR